MALTDPLIGQQLGDYRIDDLLGRGGMAHVYRGYDPKLQRYAAVKVIDSNLLAKENDDEYRLRFQREARAIAHLNHPNIVGVYQFGEVGALYYMAMIFIEGRDLGQILKEHAGRNTLLPYQQVLQIIHDIGSALDYAHAAGVIHRDIKPSNIMVTPDYHAILTDFGLALSVPEGTLGNTFGSAYYIAPEQAISSANATAQSDLYALGVVLYQMLTGKVPFDDPSAMSIALMHLSDTPPPPRSINAALTPAVEQVILKAIDKEPSKRFQSGEQMAQALQEALNLTALDAAYQLNNAPLSAPSESARQRTPLFSESEMLASRMRKRATSPRGRPILYAAVALLILAVVVIGVVVLSQNGTPTSPSPTQVADSGVSTQETLLVAVTAELTAESTAESTTAMPTQIATADAETVTTASTRRPNATPQPTTSSISATAVATIAIQASLTPTRTTSPTPTPTPTRSVTRLVASGAAGDAPIMLYYDSEKLVLVNQSDETVSVRYFGFAQQAAIGEISFYATEWQTPRLSEILPEMCLVIWRNNIPEVDTPDYCGQREAWFAAGTRSRFWISNQPDATFDVRNAGRLIATCSVSAGECAIDPDGVVN